MGLADGAMFVSLVGYFDLFKDDDITNNYGSWVNTVLLSLPSRFIFGILAQPLFALVAIGLASIAPALFVCSMIQEFFEQFVESSNRLTPVKHTFEACSKAADFLYELWLDSIGIRTVQWREASQTALEIIEQEVPEEKTVQEDTVKHVTELMNHARSIMLAQTDLNHLFTPKEQLTYLLNKYLHQGCVSAFFKSNKPCASVVKVLLSELRADESTVEDVYSKLVHQKIDGELRSIARYVKYVLVPMDEKRAFKTMNNAPIAQALAA